MRYLDVIDNAVGLHTVGDTESILDRLTSLAPEELVTLLADLHHALPSPSKKDASFRFIGNSQLSGLPFPCHEETCRARNLLQAANFCALYANEFTLFNPLQPARWQLESAGFDPVDFVAEMAFAVSSIMTLRPLIDRGMCTFVDSRSYHFCQTCYSKGLSQVLPSGSDSDLYFQFVRNFVEFTEVVYDGSIDGKTSFTVRGDEERLGHNIGGYLSSQKPKRGLKPGSVIAKKDVARLGLVSNFAFYSTNDVVHTHAVSDKYHFDSLISSSSQISVLKKVFGEDSFGKLTPADYPLLSARQLGAVLTFRDQEWHHLTDFRQFVEDAATSGIDASTELEREFSKLERLPAEPGEG